MPLNRTTPDAPFDNQVMGAAATLTGDAGSGPWAAAMADLALELHGRFTDVDALLWAVSESAVKLLPGVTAAGVVQLGKGGVLRCQTATNPQVLQLVQAEHRTGRGPCRRVLEQSNPAKVAINDISGDRRWPPYADEALSIGVAAVLAVRLDAGDAAGQALLLVSDRSWNRAVVEGVDVFVVHASVAAAQARVHAELLGAVHSRDVIGQAKGVLMQRDKISSSQAFALLVKTSQNTNIPLRQIADHIVSTGELLTSRPR